MRDVQRVGTESLSVYPSQVGPFASVYFGELLYVSSIDEGLHSRTERGSLLSPR